MTELLPGAAELALFAAAVAVLNATPGVDFLLTVTRTVQGGARAGLAAALGIGAGCVLHALAAAFGLAALLAVQPAAFIALQWAGAAWLAWLGLGLLRRAWRGAPEAAAAAGAARGPAQALWAEFRTGLLTNVLNPKVALFFLAFVPQFIDPDAPDKVTSFLLLGLLFNLNSLPVNFGYAWLAGWAGNRVQVVQRTLNWMDRVAGAMFLGFGLKLAMSDNSAH